MKFKNIKGDYITNIIDYANDIVRKDPNIRIYIGTDSQNYSTGTSFATVIAFRYSFGKGVHVLYKKDINKPKIKQLSTRLLLEAEKTIEVAEWFSQNSILKIEAVEFDVNKDTKAGSHFMESTVSGWGAGLGYKSLTKPDELVACKAANELCR